ncbi:ATP-binding protein [Streptomyces sp. NPDC056660]|uniref:wHTH domain-containing protein n=1 Tax=Streptomyces sp. NPDC056660 TaxID=3345897 RepID=UPI0036B783B4
MPDADADRHSFEAFADEYDLLVKRALLRRHAAAQIGWWLFHRWTLRRGLHADSNAIRELLDLISPAEHQLGEILTPSRVANLLHGIRRGPDVGNPEFLERLPSDDRVRASGHQRIRDRRLVLLLSLAYGTSLDITALPDIVVEHLGIPHPVDLGQLRETLEQATWGGETAFPSLRAACHHEAVIEGLQTYTARADAILHHVHRAAREWIPHSMPVLPTRLSADEVAPADGVFDGWASFRLDERRIRELLMGVQLYKDRDLAVRELYQNALDACRYHRARSEYLDRTIESISHEYEGRITFEQGIDADGRAYLECRDNGIGMGESELRGVFSQAGSRFSEQADFRLERGEWSQLDPPVELFPNSRFGIGVMSYFMLADELIVTTCRMSRNGTPGPILQASIHGPGHLFRIATLSNQGKIPGTQVRLYLRDAPEAGESWSCTDVLERMLGIAEFSTKAHHGEHHVEWLPGQLQTRKQPNKERFGLNAHGKRVIWPDAPSGAQVTWTEHGGALLVDGLVVQPAIRNGVLSSADAGLTGVVVNLSGQYAPAQLSADRLQVLDDIAPLLRNILTQAADDLAETENVLPDFTWVCRIAYQSPQLADILTNASVRVGLRLTYGRAELDLKRTGIIPSDAKTILGITAHRENEEMPWGILGDIPDHIYLWRLLAHQDHKKLEELTPFCPELNEPGPLLTAMPSDQFFLSEKSDNSEYWHWNRHSSFEEFHVAAERLGILPHIAAHRAAQLGIHDLNPGAFPPGKMDSVSGPTLLRNESRGFLQRNTKPTATQLILKSIESGRAPAEVSATWRELGIEVSEGVLSLAQAALNDELSLRLLLRDSRENSAEWFNPGEIVPPGRIAQASLEFDLSVDEVCSHFHSHGLQTDRANLPDRPEHEIVFLLRESCDEQGSWLTRSQPISAVHPLFAAAAWNKSPTEVLHFLRDIGFEISTPFPSDASVDDLVLFDDEEVGEYPEFLPPGCFPYRMIFDAVGHGRSLRQVVARVQDYGFALSFCVPDHPDDLDEELLTSSSSCSWWGVHTGNSMPFAHVIIAARSIFRPPQEIAERIASYGVSLSSLELPEGLSSENTVALLSLTRADDGYLSIESKLSLPDLLGRARMLEVSLSQIIDWLSQLGIPVPDIRNKLLQALERVPRPPS